MKDTTRPIACLAVSGSLRHVSSNTLLLKAAASVAPGGMAISLFESLGDLPHFNPDLDPLESPAVTEWIESVRGAEGFIVSSPEYAHGVPGTLKNALDWLVGSDAFVNKPFMLLNASSRSTYARDSLIEILTTMSGAYVTDASLTVPLLGSDPEEYSTLLKNGYAGQIRASLEVFADSIRARRQENL